MADLPGGSVLAERFDVCQVFLSPCSACVGDVLLSADIVNRCVTEAPLLLGRVRFLPRDTGERWNQVRSHRWYSQPHDLVRVQEVANLKATEMKPEGGRRPEDAVSISGVRPHKDFDVTCKSGC